LLRTFLGDKNIKKNLKKVQCDLLALKKEKVIYRQKKLEKDHRTKNSF